MSNEHAVLWCDTHTSESAIDKMDYGLFFLLRFGARHYLQYEREKKVKSFIFLNKQAANVLNPSNQPTS